MNNLQVAAIIYAATSALDQSAGAAQPKRWEELSEDERNQLATEANGLISKHYQGAAPSASSDGISSEDKPLKDSIKAGIVEAFCTREQELAQGAEKQEESVQSAMDKADSQIAESNAEGTAAAGFNE